MEEVKEEAVIDISSELDADSAVAVHEQLSEALRREIESQKAGARLPTEKELVARFNVSRSTVRRAIETLVDKGLLVRRQGKGTYVAGKRPVQMVDRLAPFVESFTASGLTPIVSLLEYTWFADSDSAPDPLAKQEGGILFVRRLYRAEGVPHAIAEIYVPERFGRFMSRADVEEHPIYQVLQERAGKEPRYANITLTCVAAKPHIASLLELNEGDLIPCLKRVSYGDDGEVLEVMTAPLRPDAFELRTTVGTDHSRPVSFTFGTQK
ncbi:GntR family transcriptional regulator [Aquisalimonas lutea]|uniref:GntR family transcriptional regulator n=1 Tax=Aquisalimonas lutea TaxID=1327750 RepID=UPI0025B575E1|nr:GntR family transcriptional regulator [Aquisalimonas lutea]MDN3519812.1 GntR family transcriptional regulator [Aquisalimonas lutea]